MMSTLVNFLALVSFCIARDTVDLVQLPVTTAIPEKASLEEHNVARSNGNAKWSKMDLFDLKQLSRGDTCLNFLHIPKTAGSSIEDDSAVLATWNESSDVRGWGIRDKTLKCDKPLRFSLFKPRSWRHYRPLREPHLREPFCETPPGSGADRCDRRHIPPAWDASIRSSYSDCTTFCVVRDPVQRLISEATYQGHACDTDAIATFITQFLKRLETEGFAATSGGSTCHGVSQTEYVHGGHAGNFSKKGDYCQRVLKFETLDEEFQELMQEFGLPVMLRSHAKKKNCQIVLPSNVTKAIHEYYAADYATFGYSQ